MAEFYRRKKICQMCAGKSVDYKDVPILLKYINEKGNIKDFEENREKVLQYWSIYSQYINNPVYNYDFYQPTCSDISTQHPLHYYFYKIHKLALNRS